MLKRVMSLKPTRMWIDGRAYDIIGFTKMQKKVRKLRVQATTASLLESKSDHKNQGEIPLASIGVVDNDTNIHFNIATREDGKVATCFHLPSYYYVKLNGMYSSTLKELSESTNTDIKFPKNGQDGDVLITGKTEKSVCEVRQKLHGVIAEIRNGLSAMQFIAMPIICTEVKENFEKFKAEILSWEDTVGIEESIFVKSAKLHLTIVVCALLDESEKLGAAKALEEYKETILSEVIKSTGPLNICVTGIDSMNQDHKKVDVLYANVKLLNETDVHSLQSIVNGISDYFYEKGFVIRYQENVKLHMTLINNKYRQQRTSPKKWVKRQSFDARKILDHFKDYHFGTCNLETIKLCVMSSQDEDGFYKSLFTITVT